MVRLDPDQERLLSAGPRIMEQYRTAVERAEREFIAHKAVAKNDVGRWVRAALDSGIPQRRIHLALGMQQIGQLTTFLTGGTGKLADIVSNSVEVSPVSTSMSAQPEKFKVTFLDGNKAEITDSHGTRFITDIILRDDNRTWIYPEDYAASPDASDITKYLQEKYPNVEES